MKRMAVWVCLLFCVLFLSGCREQEAFRYQECSFQREEDYIEWIPASYEGVSFNIIDATPEDLVVELQNDLEHDIEVNGWSRAYVKRENVWYIVLPAKEISTPAAGTVPAEDTAAANTIRSGDSVELSLHFPDKYQGAVLPDGEYRISLAFRFLSDRGPLRTEFGKVWMDFAIEE